MSLYFAIPLISGLVCVATGVLILSREPHQTANRCAAALLLGAGYWGVCETFWTVSADPASALFFVRLSAPGWLWVGPLTMHLFLLRPGSETRVWTRITPWLYAAPALALFAEWTTEGMHTGVIPRPWGWSYETGPVYAIWYGFTASLAMYGVARGWLEARSSDAPAERNQGPWLGAGASLPLFLGSITDGLLPVLDIHVPRLGVASFACLGVIMCWSLLRFGHSVLTPGTFAAQILSALPEGIALASPSGEIRSANERLGELVGRPVSTLVGTPIRELVPNAPLEPTRELRELECELQTPDGRSIPVGITATRVADKQGLLIGLVLVVRDLREVTELRRQLVVSGRLAAVGELAAGIAHEINNPLAFIGANLRLLGEHWARLQKAGDDASAAAVLADVLTESEELIEESIEGVNRAAGIVRDVKVLAHGGSHRRQPLDLNSVAEHALRIARTQLGGTVIEQSLSPLPTIHGSPGELEQVLLNLILNAKAAVGQQGTLQVSSRVDGASVEIVVEDDGTGIDPDVLERVFDPFFTTKPVGEGTGLGLAISHEIVRRHGGELRLESRRGEGTVARLVLPTGLRQGES
ncbi:MAG: ATP-binding protein [Myxococcales bacterium]|nr:ATP-binding protein [Myxococcales bacterium]